MQVTRATFIPLLAPGNAASSDPGVVREEFCADLTLVYGLGPAFGRRVVTHGDLEQMELSPRVLRRSAFEQLEALAARAQFHGQPPALMLSFEGLESSLLLATEFWGRLQRALPGELVVGVPARDVVIVTGSQSVPGLEKVRRAVDRVFMAGDEHLLTRGLLVRRGGTWEPFDRPARQGARGGSGVAHQHGTDLRPPRQYQEHPSWPGERVPVAAGRSTSPVEAPPSGDRPGFGGRPTPAAPLAPAAQMAMPSRPSASALPVSVIPAAVPPPALPASAPPLGLRPSSTAPTGMRSASGPPLGAPPAGPLPSGSAAARPGLAPPSFGPSRAARPPMPTSGPPMRSGPPLPRQRTGYGGFDQAARPADNAPYSAVPYSAVPYSAVPHSSVPYSSGPQSPVPQSSVPYSAVPYSSVPYSAVPYSSVPYSAVPYSAGRSGPPVGGSGYPQPTFSRGARSRPEQSKPPYRDDARPGSGPSYPSGDYAPVNPPSRPSFPSSGLSSAPPAYSAPPAHSARAYEPNTAYQREAPYERESSPDRELPYNSQSPAYPASWGSGPDTSANETFSGLFSAGDQAAPSPGWDGRSGPRARFCR